jgi:hypothetical protein
VKCGKPVGEAAPPSLAETVILKTPVVPEPPVWTPPPPAAPIPPPVVREVKGGSGAGIWIGIFAILLLIGGAGFWFYTSRVHTVSTAQVDPVPVAPSPTPEPSVVVAAPTPSPAPEVIPQNPDQQQPPAAPKPAVASKREPVAAPPAPIPNEPAPPPTRQTSGVLHAAVEVAQNGEVVFENLPGERLKFTFDHSLWKPTISHQANGTQTLVMRSLKAGIQTTCDVRWEIIP